MVELAVFDADLGPPIFTMVDLELVGVIRHHGPIVIVGVGDTILIDIVVFNLDQRVMVVQEILESTVDYFKLRYVGAR